VWLALVTAKPEDHPRQEVKPVLPIAIGMWKLLVMLVMLLAVGCGTTAKSVSLRPDDLVPANALVTQRGVLTARGKQFTLNGYLSLSEKGGMRLIVLENFGNVLADVLVQQDGTVHVMRSSPAFRPAWIERYMAKDLKCLFGRDPEPGCPAQVLSPTHFMVKRFWYSLDLHTVDVKPGMQPPQMFEPPREQKP
jgi:hypothetical protein